MVQKMLVLLVFLLSRIYYIIMKGSIFIFLLVVLYSSAFSQKDSIPIKNGKIEYVGVISVPGKSMADIYLALKQWIAEVHKTSKFVIDLDDKDAGIIVVKDNRFLSHEVGQQTKLYNLYSYQTIKVEIKNGRFKYTFSNLEIEYMYKFFGFKTNKLSAETFFIQAKTPKKEISADNETLAILDKNMKTLVIELGKYVNSLDRNW